MRKFALLLFGIFLLAITSNTVPQIKHSPIGHVVNGAIHSAVHTITSVASGGCSGVGSVPGSLINSTAAAVGISCHVVQEQITVESGGQPGAVSPAGAQGVAQFMPGTWKGQGCSGSPFNVSDAMACYVRLMKQDLNTYHGDLRNALAAYNAGAGNLSAGYGYADEIIAAAG